MTYTKDNIIGVEFTVKGERVAKNYRVTRVSSKSNVVIMSEDFQFNANARQVLKFLNNGTWVVKQKQ